MGRDQAIHDFLAVAITFVVVAYGLIFLLRWLVRTRSELRIGAPVAVGLMIRVLAAAGVGQLSVASTLRGGDELTFLARADAIAETPFGSLAWTHHVTRELHTVLFAGQLRVLDSPDLALRIVQAGIAVAGLLLLAVAVYELAGGRAAVIAAWFLALEPTNLFFSTILHKEPNMMLAGGLVAFGGAMMWKRAELRALLPVALGCLIAVATRPYAGWFLIAAGAAITLHAGLRARRQTSVRALVLVSVVVMVGAIAAPTVWEASTEENLEELQESQAANAADQEANLSLEEVDFSTRGAIVTNLPTRIGDVLFKPYPWQLDSTGQRFALVGTIVFLVVLVFLAQELWRRRGTIMERAGPFVYLGSFLLIAYSLSAGNAGTAFRYRTHVVALMLCLVVVLRFAPARGTVAVAPRRWRASYPPVGAESTQGASP